MGQKDRKELWTRRSSVRLRRVNVKGLQIVQFLNLDGLYSNVSRRFVAASRPLQELLKVLLNIPLRITRWKYLKRNLRIIELICNGLPILNTPPQSKSQCKNHKMSQSISYLIYCRSNRVSSFAVTLCQLQSQYQSTQNILYFVTALNCVLTAMRSVLRTLHVLFARWCPL